VALPVITGLDKALSSIERQIYETARFRAVGRVNEVLDAARHQWPVGFRQSATFTTKTRTYKRKLKAHSRDLFRIVDKSNGVDRVHLVINNEARDARGTPYAFYIRSAQVPGAGKKNAWQVLIRRPVLKALSVLAKQTARDPLGKG
tara:strand:+ start:46 stop:483 length:438 start_codon:yes stop_codon:yes gene_type:complete